MMHRRPRRPRRLPAALLAAALALLGCEPPSTGSDPAAARPPQPEATRARVELPGAADTAAPTTPSPTLTLEPATSAAEAAAACSHPDARLPIGSSPVLGPDDAAITLVVFNDFTCDGCVTLARDLVPAARAAYRDELRVVFKHAPSTRSGAAVDAARAAWAAGQMGQFWSYHDRLFERVDQLGASAIDPQSLGSYAADVGLDVLAFERLLESFTTLDPLAGDQALARQLGVDSVPAVFINGEPFDDALSSPALHAAIDAVLADCTD